MVTEAELDMGENEVEFRAAKYVRMSTDHQQYSTHNQSDKIQEYADKRGITIVRTYADEGKSGLSIGGRAALQRLIADVEAGQADFSIILVYDVSRWGRFQDADESAYYEYVCRRAGIEVAYCAEQFENDGSPVSTIVKGVKRAMAGEYSRELSAKVFAGQCRLIELGYRQGGSAGFGLRRVLVDERGDPKAELRRREQKSLQTDRVILVRGPEEEVEWVNRMYRWLIEEGLSFPEIAGRLNDSRIVTDQDRPWTSATVRTVLTNEKYIGNNVYNRHSFKLKKRHVDNPPDMWVRKEGAFGGIVPLEVFLTAQEIITARSARPSDEELLAHLRRLYSEAGYLSGMLIDQTPEMPSSSVYRSRFKSLARAYQMIGYWTDYDQDRITANERLRALYPEIMTRVESAIVAVGGHVERNGTTDLFTINSELAISLVLARCETMPDGRYRWRIRFDPRRYQADLTLAVRLDYGNSAELDYYLLPWLDMPQAEIRLSNCNSMAFEVFRFEDLAFFVGMAARVGIVGSGTSGRAGSGSDGYKP